MSDYAKSVDGIIHGVDALQGEHTLCGDAFDIGDTEPGEGAHSWTEVKRGPVTCPNCIVVILACKRMRIKQP